LVGDTRQKELQLAISSHSDKRQEERKDDIEVAHGFQCECGEVRNRVENRISNGGGDRDDEGDPDSDHLTNQFLIVQQKNSIENISRTDDVMVVRNE
jgi:hypothetical protein